MKTIAEILEESPRYFPGSDIPADQVGAAYNALLDSLEAMQDKPAPVLRKQPHEIARIMRAMGGSFATCFAAAWQAGDAQNRARLQAAFPDLFERYDAFPSDAERQAMLA